MSSNISAVLAVYRNLERTKNFVVDFVERFQEIPLIVSCVGSPAEEQRELNRFICHEISKTSQVVKLVTGSEDKRVSFSENWNAAINAVDTEKFVFIHNDMYLRDDFFKNLDQEIDNPNHFVLYNTVEPLANVGHVRPGKIVADFGNDVEDFKKTLFLEFTDKYIQNHQNDSIRWGYGFYLSGYTRSIENVGGFDQTRFVPVFCEDDDLNLRIYVKGYRIRVSKSAFVYHFSAKTTSGMKAGELESNRAFARKWGFEARFLWDTGYENSLNPPDIGTEKICFVGSQGFVSQLDLINLEPLVDMVQALGFNAEILKQYSLPESLWDKFSFSLSPFGSFEDVDIIIRQTGPFKFDEFAKLVGTLRFIHRRLRPGSSVMVGPFQVDVVHVKSEKREDPENYLSLQKSIKYE